MIYGIGTDMVDIKRIERLYQQYRDAFALKILSRIEYLEWQSHPQPVAFLAKRFAAKEAFSKAMNTGIRNAVTLGNIGVIHDELGKPEFWVAEPLQAWMDERGIKHVHLSLTDEGHYSVAFVVAEQ